MRFRIKSLLILVGIASLAFALFSSVLHDRRQLSHLKKTIMMEKVLSTLGNYITLVEQDSGQQNWNGFKEAAEDIRKYGYDTQGISGQHVFADGSSPVDTGNDAWDMPLVLLKHENTWILQSFGPNRRDDNLEYDDIVWYVPGYE